MKVSVIIPFKEGISFLEDCFSSLKNQTYQDMEVLLVCDHVKEDIEPLMKEYSTFLNLSIFNLDDTTGVAAARNLGLDKATGEYVYFLDSDDYLFENALEVLVSATEEQNADLVYGKKKTTWFKRSVFFATYHQAANEDDEDEDESAFDSAQLNVENGGEEDGASNVDDNQIMDDEAKGEEDGLEEDDDESSDGSVLSEAEEAYLMLKRAESKKNRAHSILLSKRKGIKNVSILHTLIKRQIVEDNQIRFHEDLKYFSDFPFVVEVLAKAESYEKRMASKYVKRKHNDSINLPSLSQIKDANRFMEFIDSYYYSIGTIPKDSVLRDRVDKKMIVYYAKLYAPRLRRSTNDAWRMERFDIMRKIAVEMNPDLIKKLKGYRKRLMKALIKGNRNKSIQVVNMHLGWIKLKKLMKSQRARMKYFYIHSYLKKPMEENWVLLESFFGKNYSDSPKYIYEYLSKNYPGKFKFIWVIDKKDTKIPYNHTKVKRFSYKYAYYLARCKYYVFNSRQPEWVRKRKGNVFLQTWHGTPLKRLVFDQDDVSSATPRYKAQVYKQSRAWDYLVAANYFSSETFKRCFMFNKTMLETGYPRNDILHDKNLDAIAAEIRKKLNIPSNKKTILYAPTWRDDEFYDKGQYKFALQMDLHQMKASLGDEYVILLRTHYFIADAIDVTGLEDFAYNLSKYDDISELYLISDILITDYSSVFFDYANLKRPMLFFTYDLEKYRDVLRGFYINIEEELPGPLLYTTDEIIDSIKNIETLGKKYSDRYEQFYEKFCGLEDGHASEKVAKAVFQLGGEKLD
jgi:CDP-glycerol glycerophosphotransferase